MNYFKGRGFAFPLGERSYIMGILNVTPDSFSDGGQFVAPERALARAKEIQAQGADILDIGAQSTRPGAEQINAQEELARLAPVLDRLQGEIRIPISVDTFYPELASYALAHGASIINDVSGGANPEMAALIRRSGAGWVLTHNAGGARAEPSYPKGVIAAVAAFFTRASAFAQGLGIAPEQLCFDPGFGFGKSMEDNYALLRGLPSLKAQGSALLVGVSRKRMLRGVAGEAIQALDAAGVAAHTAAIAGGADFLRVHAVEAAAAGARLADKLYRT